MEELKDYDISQFKSAYDALHVMGALAITNDIKSLIAGAMKQEETL